MSIFLFTCMLLKFILFFVSTFFVACDDDITNTFFKFDHCEASSTFPSLGENGLPEYGAENSLTRGSGYWCSEGKHNTNDIITWTGHLKNVRSLNGVIVHWAYAPGEVSVQASFDGNEPFEEVTPFQVIESRMGNVVQNIIFNHVIRAKAIRLNMRYPLHEYFGINFASVLGSKDPTLRIQSGMTSVTQDLCLQIDETNEVVLDGCINAIAHLDGRDLWKLNGKNQIYNPITNLCMILKDNQVANGGTIIMADCNASLEHKDGRSVWQLLPNNQLKLMREGNFCLSQEGSKSGSADVALHKEVSSTLSRGDSKMGPDKAVDGNLDSFWASQSFTLETAPDSVFFNLNLGAKYKLQKVLIDWKYPATKFSILVSSDGEHYTEVNSNLANFLRSTITNLHNMEGQYIRLKLLTPNPDFAEGEELMYGIRKLSVYSNRIKSIVDDCDKIKNSDDARDKYFFEFVSEVHLQEGKQLKRLDQELQQYAERIQNEGIRIQQLNPKLKKCRGEKESRHNEIINIKNVILKNIYDMIYQTQKIIKTNAAFTSYYSTSSKELGQSSEHPADNCFHLKRTFPSLSSGFYYILPSCSQNVLRVFCDMKLGATYFIPTVETGTIGEIKDVENVCASFGFSPIHIHHESQINTLRNLFRIMNLNVANPVPLGIRKDTETFYSLDNQESIHDIVLKFGNPSGNTFGVNNDGVVFFDSSSSEMSAFVCSDNVDSVNLPEPFVYLNCRTTLKESNDILRNVGAEYLIKCPHDCFDREVEATVIGGEGNIYSEDSAVCLSAIHAGVYDKHFLIHLRIINAPSEFEGGFQNGIISESYANEDQEIAYKLFSVPQRCPNAGVQTAFTFVEVQKERNPNMSDKNNDITTIEEDENMYVDSSTADAINDLITIVNKQVGSTDPTFLGLINKQVIKIVSNARKYLKPTELYEKNIELLSNETMKDVMKVSHRIKLLSSKIHSELDKGKYRLETMVDERLRQTEFESWRLDQEVPVHELFEVVNSIHVQAGGKWEIVGNPMEQGLTGMTLMQKGRVTGTGSSGADGSIEGSFALLRHKSFYDFVFSSYVHAKGNGSVGLIFRALDRYNFYMFQMSNSNNGFRRLLKFENNQVTELATVQDSGFEDGAWMAIRIECRSSKIKITTVKTNKPIYELPNPDIIVSDDFNAAGTIGFYSFGVDNVHFTKPTVEAVECVTKDIFLSGVAPLHCNIYEEFYVSKFNKSYMTIDPDNATDGPSNWNYANDVGNEKNVVIQKSAIKGSTRDEVPSMIILQNKVCEAGVLKFSVHPQCKEGLIGAVIKFLDPNNYTLLDMSPTFTRVRQMVNGSWNILGKSIISGYKLGTWNRITISFSSNHMNVSMGSGLMTYPIFSLIGLNLQKGEQVGLTSYNCDNVAFANIFMHPLDFKPYSPMPSVITESFIPVYDSKTGRRKDGIASTDKEIGQHQAAKSKATNRDIHYCGTHKNVVDRMIYCNEKEPDNPNCEKDFCSSCCSKIETESDEDKEQCTQLCNQVNEHAVKSSEIMDFLKKSCIESTDQFEKSCENDENKQQCINEMCQMCCQSVSIPSNLISSEIDLNSLMNHCMKLCK